MKTNWLTEPSTNVVVIIPKVRWIAVIAVIFLNFVKGLSILHGVPTGDRPVLLKQVVLNGVSSIKTKSLPCLKHSR